MVNIVMGATQKPLACEALKKFFSEVSTSEKSF